MRHALVWLIVLLIALPAAAQDEPAAPPAAETPATEPTAPAAEPDKPADAEIDQAPAEPVKPIVATDAQKSICLLLESAARANGLPVEFFARVIWQESRFRANAVGPMTRSGKRAQGIAQFMPGTAAERQPAQSVRSDSGAAEVGRVPARPAPRVRQPRARGRGLQRRPPPRARVARRHRPDAVGDAQLRCCHHRLDRRAMVQGRRRLRQEAAGRLRLRRADGDAQARAEPVRRGAGAARSSPARASPGASFSPRASRASASSAPMPSSSGVTPRS